MSRQLRPLFRSDLGSRDCYTSLSGLSAIQLNPCIRDGVVANREAVDCRPECPSWPFANMRVEGSSSNQRNQITKLGGDDGTTTQVASVADKAKEEHDWKR